VVFDEAHKLAAHFFGNKLEKTAASSFAEKLGAHTRHLLLMTATPHNGKEEDFQLFLSLLDSDRFYGKFRDGVHKVDCSDLMRRMVKEEMVKFDGTPLFPERRAYTVNYKLSDLEAALYEAVTDYVKPRWARPTNSTANARARSASRSPPCSAGSPPAPRPSSNRSSAAANVSNAACARSGSSASRAQSSPRPCSLDVPRGRRRPQRRGAGELEETLWSIRPPPRKPSPNWKARSSFCNPRDAGQGVVASGRIASGTNFRASSRTTTADARRRRAERKIIIFSEHRDTLNYLHQKIAGVLGNPDAIVTIHGGTHRDERRKARRCSAPTPTSACWSPPMPPAKASTCRTPT
jgi:hypothetical protein